MLPLTFLVKSGVNDPEFRRFQQHHAELQQLAREIEAKRAEALSVRRKQLQDLKEQRMRERRLVLPQVKRQSKEDDSYEEDSDEDTETTNDSTIADDEELKSIKRRFRVPKNVWIVKPGENTNRGNGISVASSLAEIKALVQRAAANKERTLII